MCEELQDLALEGALASALVGALAAPLSPALSALSLRSSSYRSGKELGTLPWNLARTSSTFIFTGLSTSSQAPQEVVARRITIGHPAVVQVLLLHQIFGDEPSRLPKDPVPPPSIDPQHTEEFPDLLLCGTVTIHEDDAQEHHDETRLGGHPPSLGQSFPPRLSLLMRV